MCIGTQPLTPSEPPNKEDSHMAIDEVKKTSYCDVFKDTNVNSTESLATTIEDDPLDPQEDTEESICLTKEDK